MKLRRGNSGFSLIELIIAVSVMCLSLVTLMVAITSASRINDNSRERAIAYELAKSKMEEIRNFTRCGKFDRIFFYYGHRTVTTTPNPNGQIYVGDATLPDPLQLNPIKVNGVAQPILTVTFPMNAVNTLSETPVNANFATQFGMPKDLNRNGLVTDAGATLYDVTGGTAVPATAYKIIPVMVTVQWESQGKKPSKVELASLIAEK